jgi:hypothetical protein
MGWAYWGKNVFIKLAFAYEATTQYSRTDRKPRSAHVTVLGLIGAYTHSCR